MKTYGTVPTPLWDSPRYLALSPHAKFVLLYCLTGRHSTMLGCFRLPIHYITGDSGLSHLEAEAALQEVIQQQFIVYDKETSWLLIPNYLEWNTIDNPNQGINIAKQFAAVPNDISLYLPLVKVLQTHEKYFDDEFKAELAEIAKQEGFRNEVNVSASPENRPPFKDKSTVIILPNLNKGQSRPNSAAEPMSEVKATVQKGLDEGLGNPLERVSEPFRNQYQYQEQYQEQYQYQKQEQKQEQEEKTCAELAKNANSTPTPDIVITLPIVGNKEWAVHQQQVDEWQQLYPGIDVVQALRNIKGWNLANPKRRKTKAGILRHVMSWLAKEQDRGGGIAVVQGGFSRAPGKQQSLYEYNLAVGQQWLAQRRVIDGEASVCN